MTSATISRRYKCLMGVKLIWECGGHEELRVPIQNTAEEKMVPQVHAYFLLSHYCCFVVEFLGNSGLGVILT